MSKDWLLTNDRFSFVTCAPIPSWVLGEKQPVGDSLAIAQIYPEFEIVQSLE
jgi:hypothetical protein